MTDLRFQIKYRDETLEILFHNEMTHLQLSFDDSVEFHLMDGSNICIIGLVERKQENQQLIPQQPQEPHQEHQPQTCKLSKAIIFLISFFTIFLFVLSIILTIVAMHENRNDLVITLLINDLILLIVIIIVIILYFTRPSLLKFFKNIFKGQGDVTFYFVS